MKNENQFKKISLLQRKPINLKLFFCITSTFAAIWGFGILSEHLTPSFLPYLSLLWLMPMSYCIFRIWKWYRKKQRELNVYIEKQLLFFLQSNSLFQTQTIERYDRDNKIKKEKIICNSAVLGYLITEKEIIIRGYNGDEICNIDYMLIHDHLLVGRSQYSDLLYLLHKASKMSGQNYDLELKHHADSVLKCYDIIITAYDSNGNISKTLVFDSTTKATGNSVMIGNGYSVGDPPYYLDNHGEYVY